jgi:hypothetical protein
MELTHHCGHAPRRGDRLCASCGEAVLARDVRPTPRRKVEHDV